MSKRLSIFLIICGMAALFIMVCCNPDPSESLAVQLYPQETRMWCWAASAQMVMHYLGHDVEQCVQANNRFGRTDCCNIDTCPNPPHTHACVSGGWPEFDKYGFTSKHTTNAPLSWEDLTEQISTASYCKKKPFCFTWHWVGTGGHMMVAHGYQTINEVNYVSVRDPWPPCVGDSYIITYDYYVASPGHHTHWDDYYDVTYTGGE
jgi:hypothetical protein